MPTIHCRCGGEFSDGGIPCPHQYVLIPDASVEELTKTVVEAAAREDKDAEVGYAILSAGAVTYKCPFCGRLIVFWDGLTRPPTFYKPEPD